MNKFTWVVILVVLISVMSAGMFSGGYRRSDDISNVPCLGCLGLNPVFETDFRFDARAPHPEFVIGTLDMGVVFLHYITNVCSACDEMDPVIQEIESEFPHVSFIHMNLDLDTGEKRDSYFVYDMEGSGSEITGVPMFVIMTKNRENGELKPYFKVMYGVHPKEDIVSELRYAINLYPGSEVFIPMVDLFVDENCRYCPNAEDALLEMYEDVYFVSYVTDADGISGEYSVELEQHYRDTYGGVGHPRAEFNGGVQRFIGGGEGVKDTYIDIVSRLNRSAVPAGLTLQMDEISQGYQIGYEIDSQVAGEYHLRLLLADRYSPWSNVEGEPIPFAFVDNIFDTVVELQEGQSAEDSTTWSGTDVMPYDRFGNGLCLFGMLYHDGKVVQTAHVPPKKTGISLGSQEAHIAISPLESKRVGFRVSNDMGEPVSVNVTVGDEQGWNISHIESIELDEDGNSTFYVKVQSPMDVPMGSENVMNVRVEISGREYLSRTTTVNFEVKGDSVKPRISEVKLIPEEPVRGEEVEIRVFVIDNQGVKNVEITYYVCTDVLCAPTVTEVMEEDGIGYRARIGPFEEHYEELHFTIRAEDINQNINETHMYEVELHEGDRATPLSVIPLFVSLGVSAVISIFHKGKKSGK